MKRLFRILLLFLCCFQHSFCQEKIVIGLLSTNFPVYDHEIDFSENFDTLVEKFGAELKIIDYNMIYSGYLKSNEKNPSIEELLKNELEKNGITKVIIPGNWYNLDLEPHPPLANRQIVTSALVKLSKKGIATLGICGGMQGILHAEGVGLKNIKNMGFHTDHLISYPGPHVKGVKLNKIIVDPASNFAKIIKNDKIHVNNNGWLILYLPDYHTEAVDLIPSNLNVLQKKGYKIVGFSDKGVIEIVEDHNGNVHFQPHPEGLAINAHHKEMYGDKTVEGSIIGINKFFEHFIKQQTFVKIFSKLQ